MARKSDSPDTGGSIYGKSSELLLPDVRYGLVDFHEPGGLWENRGNPDVFQENEKGQVAFAILDDDGRRTAGSANPPWGWEDIDVVTTAG